MEIGKIENTSSSPSHFELMALLKALSLGLGVSDGDKPLLLQIMDRLGAIHEIMEKSHEASEAIRAEAQVILEAHEKSAGEYMKQLDLEKPIDPYPFVSVPPGTSVKELPDGSWFFRLPDGNFVETTESLKVTFVGMDGISQPITIEGAGKVPLPNDYVLMMDMNALKVPQAVAQIEGVPSDANITQVGDKNYRVELEEGLRLEISHPDCMVIVINPEGIIDLLNITRIEGIGEDIEVRMISGGAKGFACQKTKHQGMIESNGTIHLSLSNGSDLIIRFSDQDAVGQSGEDNQIKPEHFHCEDCT